MTMHALPQQTLTGLGLLVRYRPSCILAAAIDYDHAALAPVDYKGQTCVTRVEQVVQPSRWRSMPPVLVLHLSDPAVVSAHGPQSVLQHG